LDYTNSSPQVNHPHVDSNIENQLNHINKTDMELKSKNDLVVELVTKLFVYTDSREWKKLLGEVFMEEVTFDMSSLGAGAATKMKALEICNMWQKGFEGIDHVHHHAGNYIVKFNSDTEAIAADISCYATATHYREAATKGKTRDFIGTYYLHASLTDIGWRLDKFTYDLKFIMGNKDLV
jgi:hypothetical protein